MKIVRGLDAVSGTDRGSHAAIGNFDGVHCGHRAIIASAVAAATRMSGRVSVVTFEPHPRMFFGRDAGFFRLTLPPRKERLLRALGVDLLFEIPFDAVLAAMSARAFVEDVLIGRLGLHTAVTGADFRFGRGRSGDAELLRSLAAVGGCKVTVAPMAGAGGAVYSSSAIRAALAAGNPGEAARQLGDWHRIEGAVETGAGEGRRLGMPTANIAVRPGPGPSFGVYAVQVEIRDGREETLLPGVANLGISPMFPGREPRLEVHVLDFEEDLYGKFLSVALVARLRGERKFDSVGDLMLRMQRDAAMARTALAAAPRPSGP